MRESSGIIQLVLLLVAIPLFIWSSALSRTASLFQEYRALTSPPQEIPITEQVISVPEEQILMGDILLGDVESFCASECVTISCYTPVVKKNEASMTMYLAKLQTKGRFIPLLKLCDHLEEIDGVGLSSIAFFRKNDKDEWITMEVELIQVVRDEKKR